MAVSVVSNAKYEIMDNMLVITLPDGIKDNSRYDIRIKNLRSFDGLSSLDNLSHTIITELTPSYCNISDVQILKDTFNVPESTILYYIREASKYADYINDNSDSSSEEISFPMREFVKIKTLRDCLLHAYTKRAASTGGKYRLGEISFEDSEKYASSIDDLLDDLSVQLKKWEDAIRGYEFEGRVAPKFAVRGHKSQATDTATYSDIVDSMERTNVTGV